VRTRPVYNHQQSIGAVFGLNYGWEHPLWFAAPGEPTTETYGFTRQNWWEPVGREARMLREKVGVIDISNYAKYVVKGPGAYQWLSLLFANKMPTKIGATCLTPLIGVHGGVAGDFTVTKIVEDEFRIFGSGMAERFHARWFKKNPLPDGTRFESVTDALCGFNVAGPLARSVLSRLTNADLTNGEFPFMHSKLIDVAGVHCIALRLSFTGDLGWELYCDSADQPKLYGALLDAVAEVGGGPVGSRALGSLRLEKGYGSWGRDYSPEYWPHESGLGGLVKSEKPFLNRAAWEKISQQKPRYLMCMLGIDAAEADASGGEPVFAEDGTPIGNVTTGGYGYHVGKSLAIAYVETRFHVPGAVVHVAILGRDVAARILDRPPFDPDGLRLRS
jgi:dimethylglycine dehydrogenase